MNEINCLPISFSTITFMSCQDRKISLNAGHFEKYKSSRAQVNYHFWLNLVENVQKILKILKIHQKNRKIQDSICFCSHFLPLRSLWLIFYMVEDKWYLSSITIKQARSQKVFKTDIVLSSFGSSKFFIKFTNFSQFHLEG